VREYHSQLLSQTRHKTPDHFATIIAIRSIASATAIKTPNYRLPISPSPSKYCRAFLKRDFAHIKSVIHHITTMAQVQLRYAQEHIVSESRIGQTQERPLISSTAIPASISKLPRSELDKATRSLHSHTIEGDDILQELFAENVAAKIWRVATRDLECNVS
jgi:hypothetical protein